MLQPGLGASFAMDHAHVLGTGTPDMGTFKRGACVICGCTCSGLLTGLLNLLICCAGDGGSESLLR